VFAAGGFGVHPTRSAESQGLLHGVPIQLVWHNHRIKRVVCAATAAITPPTRDWLTERSKILSEELAQLRDVIASKERELAWCNQGLEFAPDAPASEKPVAAIPNRDQDGEAPLALRPAILYVMRQEPDRLWTTPEVIRRLNDVGRLPGAKSAKQMVRNRLVEAEKSGDLIKVGTAFRVTPSTQGQLAA
jgi:hypothetical protein